MIQLSEHFSYKKLIRFTLPTIIMMIFTSIYGVVDGIFVSNVVGSEAFAGVNLIMPAIMILGSVGFMIGTGGSALVAKTIGEGKEEEANRYFSMLIYLVIIVGIILALVGCLLVNPISQMLGAKGDLVSICTSYGRIIMLALPAFLLQNCFQSFLVVAEKPKMGLVISVIAGVINMALDFLFISILHMGVVGAALATTISQIFGGIIPLFYFFHKNSTKLRLIKTTFAWKPILHTCANGSSEMVTNISMSLVNMLYNFQLLKYAGANGVVSYGIIMYVGFIFIGTYLGYAIGVAPIIGYHYGAENHEELKNILRKSIHMLVIASTVMTIGAELAARPLAKIFVSYDPALLKMTVTAIRLYAFSYLMSGINIFASSFFTALNNGIISAIISFLRTLVFQVAMILLLPMIFKLNGIWLSVSAAEIFSLLLSISFLIAKRKQYHYD